MNLKCAQRGDMDSESNPIFLCHHCGKPVCNDHGKRLEIDDAFADSGPPHSRSAMHCPECVKHHSEAVGGERGAGAAP